MPEKHAPAPPAIAHQMNEAGEMVAFEVVILPLKALQALSEARGNPDRRGPCPPQAGRGGLNFAPVRRNSAGPPRLRQRGPCGKNRPRLIGPFWPILQVRCPSRGMLP